jgi:hypothetical protein
MVLLAAATTVRADAGPRVTRNTTPEVRIDNLDEYPDLTFYVVHDAIGGWRCTEARPGEPIPLVQCGRWGCFMIIAVPLGNRPPIPWRMEYGIDAEKWLKQNRPDVFRSEITKAEPEVFLIDPTDHYLQPVRVRVVSGTQTISVAKLPPQRRYSAASGGAIAIGVALSAFVLAVGLIVLRMRRIAHGNRKQ